MKVNGIEWESYISERKLRRRLCGKCVRLMFVQECFKFKLHIFMFIFYTFGRCAAVRRWRALIREKWYYFVQIMRGNAIVAQRCVFIRQRVSGRRVSFGIGSGIGTPSAIATTDRDLSKTLKPNSSAVVVKPLS